MSSNRFQGRGGLVAAAASTSDNLEKYMGKSIIGGSGKRLDNNDYERMTVKGTCRTLEKEYLRLTSPRAPSWSAPRRSCRGTWTTSKKMYYKEGKVHDGRNWEYDWYCSQFKALRQDLTVQRIANAFTVGVYETHAKVALEEDDINEYNQSQTQLKELYDVIDGRGRRKGESKGKKIGIR